MWILIFWLSTPFSGSSNVARQPTLAVHSQEFGSERACKDALTAMNDATWCVSLKMSREFADNAGREIRSYGLVSTTDEK